MVRPWLTEPEAEIVGKEFMYGMAYDRASIQRQERRASETGRTLIEINDASYRFPFAIGGDFSGWFNRPDVNSEGGPVLLPAWEAHCGRAPLYVDLDSIPRGQREWLKEYLKRIGTAQADKIGLDVFKAGKIKWPASRIMTNSIFGGGSGVWPTDTSCASSLPGLYAAGNSLRNHGIRCNVRLDGVQSKPRGSDGRTGGHRRSRICLEGRGSDPGRDGIIRGKADCLYTHASQGRFQPGLANASIASHYSPILRSQRQA